MKSSREFFKMFAECCITAIIIVIILLLMGSCTSQKKSFVKSDNTSYIAASDSGQVKKSESKNESEWWREILTYIPKDSTYIEKTTPYYIEKTVPVYIREGGSSRSTNISVDSVWSKRIDSLLSVINTVDKESKTKVLGLWQIVGLVFGSCVVFLLGAALIKRIRIV